MHSTAAIVLALQCTLCLCIRVPIVWNDDNSEVNNNNQFAVDTVQSQNDVNNNQKPIPVEYFQYTAQKPKFAVDIAKFHGVQSPENLYKAHPIKPHTGVTNPELGKHHMLEKEKKIFHPFQTYVNKNEAERYVTPATSNYEIFHPYKLEEPALKELYQDPVMDKIRNDLLNSKNRLQKYENEAGEPDITKNEYLESPEETDRKKFPHRNIPATYEIHRPQRRPVYYRPPSIPHHREHVLNQKFRHPWHQNYVKVKPLHYRPIKNHLQRLRQQHALKYDDEHNEYPQLPPPEKYSEPSDGYDIYEKGKAKFVQLRNNVDESINESVQKNRPIINQNLELNNDDSDNNNTADDEDEFIPIKNYAQVRRTETTKHLPKEAAFHDADTLDEIQNAPRLREAIKSTKAQTVYSEEGYEDSAYDHAGEHKHASDHEGHGGFLKEKEISGGKYKTPTFTAKYKDDDSSEYRNQILDGKKWKDDNKDTEEEIESEEYTEIEQEQSAESGDIYNHKLKKNTSDKINKSNENNNSSEDEETERLKREDTPVESHVDTTSENYSNSSEHDVNKREAKIEVPKVNLNTTYLTQKEILKLPISLLKLTEIPKVESMQEKYPYYFKKLKSVSKDSPLRYAENLRLIPKKSEGGTEFYDSRSKFECPEVDDKVDPIPEKLKKGGHPDEHNEDDNHDVEDNEKDKADFSGLDEKPRLSGLGDKIDCFKAKYFGENPLDSPFFQEEIISNPEPVTVPNIDIYKLKEVKEKFPQQHKLNTILTLPEELQANVTYDSFIIPEKSNQKQNSKITKPKMEKERILVPDFKEIQENPQLNINVIKLKGNPEVPQNNKYLVSEQKQDVIKTRGRLRKRRATPFIYEPYKIIKDSQIQDSKKTTTTNNISPLIKQLQSSRVVDRVANNQGKDQVVKRNARTYKDIGKNDREKSIGKEKGSQPIYDASFVDVSVDQRRGEPKYELRPNNHKSEYTPVENRKSMTVEDYKVQLNSDVNSEDYDLIQNKQIAEGHQIKSTTKPYFDASKFLPHSQESLKSEKSSAKQKETKLQSRSDEPSKSTENEDDYDEYDDDDNERTTTTTTTVRIPQRRRKITITSTTEKPHKVDDDSANVQKLRLITRFRDSYQTEEPEITHFSEKPMRKVYADDTESITAPKYREKKKKSSKSTLVTDTKSYGEDDDDDLRKAEVDALIGVKQNAKEYMPEYEKLTRKKDNTDKNQPKSQEDEEDEDNDEDDHDEDEDSDDDNEDDDDGEDEDDNDEYEEDGNDEEENKNETNKQTTPEPTKRTLAKTTEAPLATTEARGAKLEVKPVVVKKKIEIHKELPVNRSSPHISEFKQDIKEVEIIKEIPSKSKKKPQKNIEALELYKDENLAKDVNKLGGVEIFKEGLDLVNGPKHGGNYRIAEGLADESFVLPLRRKENKNLSKDDVVASQSKTSKYFEVKDDPYTKLKTDTKGARGNYGRSAKIIELSDSTERATSRPMHGGNFKSIHDERRRGSGRNAKLIELDDSDSGENDSTSTHGGDFKSYGSRSGNRNHMHGGNYRSAKIIQADNNEDTKSNKRENLNRRNMNKDGRRNAAMFLSSIASAVPIMTTTPVYILDPSKRMYYYVDA